MIDPYDYFHAFSHPKVNEKKILFQDKRREAFERIEQIRPKTIILGSSRSLIGMPASKFEGMPEPIVNASFERASFYEIYRFFEFALQQQSVKEIILTLDFFSFNAYLKPLEQFDEIEDLLSDKKSNISLLKKRIKALTSQDAVWKSIQTIQYNLVGRHVAPIQLLGAKELCNRMERSQINTHVFFPLPLKKFEFVNLETKGDSFVYFKKILELAEKNDIQLKLVILPMHARMMMLVKEIGLWSKFELWKRNLVEIANPIAIYDFAYFEDYNIETPPSDHQMQWYTESLHFKPNLGQLVTDKLFDKASTESFGTVLTPDSLEAHLLQARLDLEQYALTHPNDYQDIRQTAKLAGV